MGSMRGNMKMNHGGRKQGDPADESLSYHGDIKERDDQIRVSPRLRKLMTAKLAARALGSRSKSC